MKKSEHLWLYVIMIIAMASWGLSWTNGKILGTFTSVPNLMFWRFLIAAGAMIPVLIFTGKSWKLNGQAALRILASAVLLNLYNFFYFTGTHVGHAGAGGVLVTTLNPIVTYIFVLAIQRELPGGRTLVGILMGLLGGTIIINFWGNGWQAILVSGNQYFVFCSLTWALLTLISASINRHINVLGYSFWLYLASAGLAFFLVDSHTVLQVFGLDWIFWLNLFSVSFGAMAFATTAYFIATSRLGSNKAAAFIFTVPVSAMLFSMLILHEALKLNVLLGGLFSIAAVYTINSSRKI